MPRKLSGIPLLGALSLSGSFPHRRLARALHDSPERRDGVVSLCAAATARGRSACRSEFLGRATMLLTSRRKLCAANRPPQVRGEGPSDRRRTEAGTSLAAGAASCREGIGLEILGTRASQPVFVWRTLFPCFGITRA